MVRDPRDAIASKIRVLEKSQRQRKTPLDGAENRNLTAHCQQFQTYYAPLLSGKGALRGSRLCYVRYEDLVTAPEKVVAYLRSFTGLKLRNLDFGSDFDTGAVDYANADAGWQPWISPHYGKAVTASRIGAYKDVFSRAEIAEIDKACEPFMRHFAYV